MGAHEVGHQAGLVHEKYPNGKKRNKKDKTDIMLPELQTAPGMLFFTVYDLMPMNETKTTMDRKSKASK